MRNCGFFTKLQRYPPQEYQFPSYNSPHHSTDKHMLRRAPVAWLGAACLRSTDAQYQFRFLLRPYFPIQSTRDGMDRTGLTFIFVWKSGAASIFAVICVRTNPGEMLLTRIPWGAHSIARVWVMLRRAALVPPLLGENVSEWSFLIYSMCLGPFGDVGRDYSSRIGRHGEDGRTYCECIC